MSVGLAPALEAAPGRGVGLQGAVRARGGHRLHDLGGHRVGQFGLHGGIDAVLPGDKDRNCSLRRHSATVSAPTDILSSSRYPRAFWCVRGGIQLTVRSGSVPVKVWEKTAFASTGDSDSTRLGHYHQRRRRRARRLGIPCLPKTVLRQRRSYPQSRSVRRAAPTRLLFRGFCEHEGASTPVFLPPWGFHPG